MSLKVTAWNVPSINGLNEMIYDEWNIVQQLVDKLKKINWSLTFVLTGESKSLLIENVGIEPPDEASPDRLLNNISLQTDDFHLNFESWKKGKIK